MWLHDHTEWGGGILSQLSRKLNAIFLVVSKNSFLLTTNGVQCEGRSEGGASKQAIFCRCTLGRGRAGIPGSLPPSPRIIILSKPLFSVSRVEG